MVEPKKCILFAAPPVDEAFAPWPTGRHHQLAPAPSLISVNKCMSL
jgi:hypothetical protein